MSFGKSILRGSVRRYPRLIGPDGDLDLVPVRVLEKGGVGPRAVRALVARVADADAARFDPVLPGRLDRDDAQGREAQQPEPGLGVVLAGDEEDRFGDAPADRLILLEMPSPAQRGQHRVVEGGTAVEIADLQEDVVEHWTGEAIGASPGKAARSA